MLSRKTEYFILAIFSMLMGGFVISSEGFHGGGDSLAHFRIAKFSWEHPEYLLDHWGKPFFTLLAMPFSYFGFKGIQFFNLLMGIFTSILIIKISNLFKWRFAWLGIVIVFFVPIYMQEFFSGLTELAFSSLLLLSLFLRLKKKYAASFLLLSFLPFIRTEGVLFLAWFGIIDLLERKSWQPVLLLTGTILYSIIGWMTKGDVLWIINEMPYTGGEHIYGSGSIWHYLNLMPDKIGWAVLFFALVGLVFLPLNVLTQERDAKWLLLYVVIPTVVYIGFHSIMWYVGRVSLGLPRMLAVVVPLLAILAVYGLNRVNGLFENQKPVTIVGIALAGLILFNGASKVELPVELGAEEKVLNEVAAYIRANGLSNHKIHYYSLYNEVSLGLDPHYPEQCQQVIHNRSNPHEEVKPGSLVIWDAHFSPNEGAMPLENLTTNQHFEVLKVFKPKPAFNTLGDKSFEVYLFLRKPD